MDERHAGDYELQALSYDTALLNLDQAKQFLERVEEVLREIGVLS